MIRRLFLFTLYAFSVTLNAQQLVKPKATFIVSNCVPSFIVPNATTCVFHGSKSGPRIKLWTWDWGTGRAKETHPFAANKNTFPPGKYTIKLVVTDSLGMRSNPSQLTLTFPLAVKPPVVKPPATKPKPDTVYLPGRTDTLRLPGRVDTVRVPARVDTVTVGFKTDTLFRAQPPGSIYSTVPANLPAGVTIRSPQSEYAVLRYGVMMGRLSPDYPGNWWAYRATPGRTEMPIVGHYTSALAAIVALTGP